MGEALKQRSQQYKEALKLKKEIEARIAKEMEVENGKKYITGNSLLYLLIVDY